MRFSGCSEISLICPGIFSFIFDELGYFQLCALIRLFLSQLNIHLHYFIIETLFDDFYLHKVFLNYACVLDFIISISYIHDSFSFAWRVFFRLFYLTNNINLKLS